MTGARQARAGGIEPPARPHRRRSLRAKLVLLVVIPVSVAATLAAVAAAWREGGSAGVLARLLANLPITLAAALAAVAAGLLLAWRLQRSMAAPLQGLARSMAEVRGDHDYVRSVDIAAEDELGELVGAYTALLGEIHLRDQRLAQQIAGLEREVAARAADLQRAKAAAEAAKADLAAAVSHELRSPLEGVAGLAAALAAAETPACQRRIAEAIGNSGPSLLATLDELVELSKPETGEIEPDAVATGPGELVEEVASLFWPSASSKGLDLAVYVDPATPRAIEGDPTRLRQVVSHLVNNAIASTETGGVLIEVEPDSPKTLRISVRDTSPGMPKENIPGVFNALSRTDPAIPPRFAGGGLGLAVCKRLVDAMGGRFHVTSELGRGSAFAFRIPMAVVEPAPEWPAAPEPAAKARIAHDGVSTRRALGRYLARAGYSLASADEPAAIVFGLPAELPPEPATTPTVRLAGLGDASASQLIETDVAHAVLVQPVRRSELQLLLRRMQAGQALSDGPAVPVEELQARPAPAAGPAELIEGVAEVPTRARGLYRELAPPAVARLLSAVESGQGADAAKAAHALEAMSLNVGAKAVAARTAAMEAAARDGRLPSPAEIAELKRLLDATLAVLDGPRAAGAAPPAVAPPPPPRGDLSPEVRELLEDLDRAIGAGQLGLVYQPQFDRDGREILGVETLIRWTHPTRGQVSPALFIPLAEEHGRIHRLTDWVMTRALAETADLPGLQVAFNASALEFTDASIVSRIRSLIERTGFDPRRLEVEITETAILENEDQVRENMNVLRGMGMKVALDDFGAGYSSLGHLRRYPFDKLKIDREFVIDCTRDVQSATVVHAVVSIGRALGMKVVAEGVETEQQRQFLKIAGVHAMQGFLFGKPAPIEVLKESLFSARNAGRLTA